LPGPAGGNGSAGQGGAGGGVISPAKTYAAGGGGGGGVTGGGGGGANGDLHDSLDLVPAQAPGSGGGGGGNSTGPAGTTFEDGVRSGDGLIKIIAGDDEGPAVTLDTPVDGSSTNDTTPTFSGVRGAHENDLPAVAIDIYDSNDNFIHTMTAPSGGAGYSTDNANLSDGSYKAQARQSDLSGNTGLSPFVAFTIDTADPTVSITSPGDGDATNDTTPEIEGDASDPDDVTVNVYSGSSAGGTAIQTPTATPDGGGIWSVDLSSLSDGTYTVQAEQTDAAGNTGTSLEATFTVDTQAPTATIGSKPKGKTTKRKATFTFTSSQTPATFECSLDGLTPAPCDSGTVTYTNLKRGSHTFEVTATDAAGNESAPATFTWKVIKKKTSAPPPVFPPTPPPHGVCVGC
jgi:hypothetical protein